MGKKQTNNIGVKMQRINATIKTERSSVIRRILYLIKFYILNMFLIHYFFLKKNTIININSKNEFIS